MDDKLNWKLKVSFQNEVKLSKFSSFSLFPLIYLPPPPSKLQIIFYANLTLTASFSFLAKLFLSKRLNSSENNFDRNKFFEKLKNIFVYHSQSNWMFHIYWRDKYFKIFQFYIFILVSFFSSTHFPHLDIIFLVIVYRSFDFDIGAVCVHACELMERKSSWWQSLCWIKVSYSLNTLLMWVFKAKRIS